MGFSSAFAFALIIFCFASTVQAIDGYSAPLIDRSSPKHPLYNPNATLDDLARERKRISLARWRFFARQQRQGIIRSNMVAPISFDVLMAYLIGTPPVEALAVPDTGSHLLWQQCQPCKLCYNQTKPIFEPRKSTTYRLVDCKSPVCTKENGFYCGTKGSACLYEVRYADRSITGGIVGTDSLTLPGNQLYPEVTLPNTVFGCGTYNDVKFTDTGYSGIVGLTNNSISLVKQLGAHTFSFCTGKNGGLIHFGQTARMRGSTTILDMDSWNMYQVRLLAIAVGAAGNPGSISNLDIPSEIFKPVKDKPHTGATVDTGTGYSLLPPVAYLALKRRIGDFMSKYESYRTTLYDLCYNADEDEDGVLSVETMPTVVFVFENFSLKWPNKNVWTAPNVDGDICLQMGTYNFPGYTIIGMEQLKDFNVGWDLKEHKIYFDYNPDCY